MNAGRGREYNKCISEYIISVDVLFRGEVKTVMKKDCNFAYRTSKFQFMPGCVILGALFDFPTMPKDETSEKIQERIDLCKSIQDMSAPNYGTVFCQSNRYIMTIVKKIHFGYKNGCYFSSKTKNWMLHGVNGTFEQAIYLLNIIKKCHSLLRLKCKTEVKIWE